MRQTRSVPLQAKLWGVSTNKVLAFIWSGELSAINLATDPNGRPRYAIRIADDVLQAIDAAPVLQLTYGVKAVAL